MSILLWDGLESFVSNLNINLFLLATSWQIKSHKPTCQEGLCVKSFGCILRQEDTNVHITHCSSKWFRLGSRWPRWSLSTCGWILVHLSLVLHSTDYVSDRRRWCLPATPCYYPAVVTPCPWLSCLLIKKWIHICFPSITRFFITNKKMALHRKYLPNL
jgi:hypothetical protein